MGHHHSFFCMTARRSFNLMTILGPTASGKTRLAVALAREFGGEIISADSRQVFRGMDIGSGKDLNEYGEVPYHLIDVLEAGGEFSVFAFQRLFLTAFAEISGRGRLPLLCGGSGMYLDSVLRGYEMTEVPFDRELRAELENSPDDELRDILLKLRPQQHNSTDIQERERTIRAIEIARHREGAPKEAGALREIRPLVLGIRLARDELRRRITERLKFRLDNGLIEEVLGLCEEGMTWERLSYYGLEYRYVGSFLRGELNRNDMFQQLNSAINDFAKRQEKWFRRMERDGVVIHWLDGADEPLAEALELVRLSERN